MERDRGFWEALREQAAERHRSSEAPSPDEVLAFVEGRLDGAERERVAEAMAAHPAAARLALDLKAFPDAAPGTGRDDASAPAAADIWHRIEDGLAGASSAAAPAAAPGDPARLDRAGRGSATVAPRRAGGEWWVAVAAAIAGAAIGVAGVRIADRDLPQPNPEILTLAPRGEGVTRGGRSERRPAGDEPERLVLILEYAGPTEPGHQALVLRDARGRVLWTTRDLRRGDDGSFTISVPAGFLGPGPHTLELHRGDGTASPPLAVYDLDPGRRATR